MQRDLDEISATKAWLICLWYSPKVGADIWWANCCSQAELLKRLFSLRLDRRDRAIYFLILLRGFLYPGINENFWQKELESLSTRKQNLIEKGEWL
jgi:hypothetical protein